MVNQRPVDGHPVMRPGDLADGIIEGLDANVVWLSHEHPRILARRNPAHVRCDHFDNEPAGRGKGGRSAAKHLGLLRLRREVCDVPAPHVCSHE